MNKIRYILGIVYIAGILYGCHKSGTAPASSADADGSMTVAMTASPYKDVTSPNTDNSIPLPGASKTSTRVVGPDFSHYNTVNVEIHGITVHSPTMGWIELQTKNGVYNLMDLRNGREAIVVEKSSVPAGQFDKIALTIGDHSSVVIDNVNYTLKTNASLNPNVPMRSEVSGGRNTKITLDFNAKNSVSCVDYGSFLLNPSVAVKAISMN